MRENIRVQIVLFEGFDPLDVVAPYEVLWAGGLVTDGAVSVELVSTEGPGEVTGGSGGLVLHADALFDPERADLVIIPGASGKLGTSVNVPETDKADTVPALLARTSQTTGLPRLLERALENPDVTVATVCGGSLVLAMAGLIEGRHAVTHHMGMDVLGATGAIPVDARIVDDGDLVTAGGVTSGLDLGVYLLERELGPRVARSVERLFEYERRGTVWKASGLEPLDLEGDDYPSQVSRPDTLSQESGETEDAKEVKESPGATLPSVTGTWELIISTPIGKQHVLLDLREEDGVIEGIARGEAEQTPLIDPVLDGNRLTWRQSITRPMRLNLKFEVTIDGDTLTGISKAGMLPASRVAGTRTSLSTPGSDLEDHPRGSRERVSS
jgi:transcriptional regulator GlxA family with amidase domain